jgi:hypothetical protein
MLLLVCTVPLKHQEAYFTDDVDDDDDDDVLTMVSAANLRFCFLVYLYLMPYSAIALFSAASLYAWNSSS